MFDTCSCSQIPEFLDLLSPADKLEYESLAALLKEQGALPLRDRRIKTFDDELEEIKKYSCRSDSSDARRALVCGIFWFPDGVCINTRQLRLLVSKSKSAINTALAKLGYEPFPPRQKAEEQRKLLELLPMLKNNITASRQWTIRMRDLPKTEEAAEEPPAKEAVAEEPPCKCCYGCRCGCTCQPGDEHTNCMCCFPRGVSFGTGACPCADAIWEREE